MTVVSNNKNTVKTLPGSKEHIPILLNPIASDKKAKSAKNVEPDTTAKCLNL